MPLVEYVPGIDYGIGFDMLSGRVRGQSIHETDPEGVTGAEGQTLYFDIQKATDTTSLQKALGVTVEASASWGLASVSAKASYAESCNVNSFSLYAVVTVVATNGLRQMRDPRFTTHAESLVVNGKEDPFYRMYGDNFSLGLLTGGEYYATLEINTKSSQQRQEIEAELDASYGTAGIEAKVKSTLDKHKDSASIKIHSFQRGGNTVQVDAIEEVIDKAKAFGPTVEGDKSVPFQALLQDYEIIPVESPPNWLDVRQAKDVMRFLIKRRSDLLLMLNDVEYVLVHPDEFIMEAADSDTLAEARNDVAQELNKVTEQASHTIDFPNEAKFPTDMKNIVFDLPKRVDGGEKTQAKADLPADFIANVGKIMGTRIQYEPDKNEVTDVDGTSRKLTGAERGFVALLGKG